MQAEWRGGACFIIYTWRDVYDKQSGKDIRGTQEEFCHAEKPGSVLEVQDVAVKEGVEAGVERGVVPASPSR